MKIEIDTNLLFDALVAWENDRRGGECKTVDEIDTQSVEQVASESFTALLDYYQAAERKSNGL